MELTCDATIDLADAEAAAVRWASTVWRLVRCRLHSRADAEDAFQNTFLALCKSQPAFESLEHQKAWLLRCAINCCNQIGRAHATRGVVPLDACGEAALAVAAPADQGPDEDLAAALARLSDKQRTAVHLFYFEGYSTDEIASITHERPATVRSHLRRARQALRLQLERGEAVQQ